MGGPHETTMKTIVDWNLPVMCLQETRAAGSRWKKQYGFDRVYTAEDPKQNAGDEGAGCGATGQTRTWCGNGYSRFTSGRPAEDERGRLI